METLRYEARGTFRVSPEALWPLISDTARMNRAIGLPPIEYTVTPADDGGSHVEAQMRLFGLPLARYTEHPFRWEAPHGFVVVREFHTGPLRWVRAGTRLTPRDGGTEVLIYGEFLPRNALGAVLVRRVVGPRSVERALRQCRRFEQYLLGQAGDPFPQLAGKKGLSVRATSAAAQLARQSSSQQGVELLRSHLAEASDDQVVKMRPFVLADRWGLDRRETLALFLHATVAGLLGMSWDVLCPNCRVGKAEYATLGDLAGQAHCETCNITFDASFDRSVEVRFSVAPALRRVEHHEFCIGGPMNTPHVLAQASLPPGATEHLRCSLVPGSYHLRARPSPGRLWLEATDDSAVPGSLAITLSAEGIEPATAALSAGPVSLEVANHTDHEQLVALEGSLWPDTIATAAIVSTMQEFRDLFSSEALAPGLQLGIENLAFMFTDLTSSTAMYQAIGQARAFRLVQDHFRVLRAAISANRGAFVKTIGDAVMATFPSGADALAAGLQIQRDIRGLTAPEGVDVAHFVKIGLHQGPCVAVNLNDRLDYFGTTVNTAARIEHECRGGQLVASLAVCQSDGATALLEESDATLEAEVVRLRGIAEPVPVYRITPQP
ncbi:MAG: hypothetical protein H0V51_08350 [Chloroflexi bacterium]|nr:hypothetical protein [Chloroflexota bacterium]